jgi:hypothetical protein
VKQAETHLPFEQGDLLADSRLDEVEGLGGARHTAKIGHALEAGQLAQIHSRASEPRSGT